MEAANLDNSISREDRQTRDELKRLWTYTRQADATEEQFVELALGLVERVKVREAARLQNCVILAGKVVERRG